MPLSDEDECDLRRRGYERWWPGSVLCHLRHPKVHKDCVFELEEPKKKGDGRYIAKAERGKYTTRLSSRLVVGRCWVTGVWALPGGGRDHHLQLEHGWKGGRGGKGKGAFRGIVCGRENP